MKKGLWVLFLFLPGTLWAYPNVVIQEFSTANNLPIPVHHALVVKISEITDPNLLGFEVHFKDDSPEKKNPFTPWQLYSKNLRPYRSSVIILPYRNDFGGLKGKKQYCIRLRPIFGSALGPWTQSCGVTLEVGVDDPQDPDGDNLPNSGEYLAGFDIYNPDTDGDGVPDGEEVASEINPKKDYNNQKIKLIADNTLVDLGLGDPFGSYPNQHGLIVFRNAGSDKAFINEVIVEDDPAYPGSKNYFLLGSYPKEITPTAPQNYVRIPVSFYPKKRGDFAIHVTINTNSETQLPVFTVKGTGIDIPDCFISPAELDFGTVSKNDQKVLVKEVTFANKPIPGDPSPPNVDTPWGFTLSTTIPGMAPGIRGFVLQKGEEIKIPVLFQHMETGSFDGDLLVSSATCGIQIVKLKANVVE